MANKSINKEFGTLLGTNAADTLSVRGNGNKILAEGGAAKNTITSSIPAWGTNRR